MMPHDKAKPEFLPMDPWKSKMPSLKKKKGKRGTGTTCYCFSSAHPAQPPPDSSPARGRAGEAESGKAAWPRSGSHQRQSRTRPPGSLRVGLGSAPVQALRSSLFIHQLQRSSNGTLIFFLKFSLKGLEWKCIIN